MVDLLAGNEETPQKIDVLDNGYVELWDMMPRVIPDDEGLTADFAVVQAARASYQKGTKTLSDDRNLIRYLMRHRHTTPFEMIEFKFAVQLPIFAARQMIRHRTANVNEMSGRYSVLPDVFYIPSKEEIRTQSQTNKQATDSMLESQSAEQFANTLRELSEEAYQKYEKALEEGVCREQARALLPVNIYTNWVWKIDLHNLLHFLALRCDSHAQYEIRVFANAMLDLIRPLVPMTIEAWEDYHPMRGGMMLTKYEVQAIRDIVCQVPGVDAGIIAPSLKSDNKREQSEWMQKAKQLGFVTPNQVK